MMKIVLKCVEDWLKWKVCLWGFLRRSGKIALDLAEEYDYLDKKAKIVVILPDSGNLIYKTI